MRSAIRIVALALASLALLYLLASWGRVTGQGVARAVSAFPVWAFACVLALTGANITLGTSKWLLTMRAFGYGDEKHPSFTDAMLTTAFGDLLGQVVPVQAGVALARSLAVRLGIGWSARVSLGTTLYEQTFDLAVLCAAATVGFIGLALHPTVVGWATLILLSVLATVVAALQLPSLLAATAGLLGYMRFDTQAGLVDALHSASERVANLALRQVLKLTALSIVRYIANLGRVAAVLAAMGMQAYAVHALIAFPVIQGIRALPLTPGNLGVTEWTWSAVLVSGGASIGIAALFAFTARIVNVASIMLLVILLYIAHSLKALPSAKRVES